MDGPNAAASSIDKDPAAPLPGEYAPGNANETYLSNYGADRPLDFPVETGLVPTTLVLDYAVVTSFLHNCMTSVLRVGYHLGSKVPSLTAKPGVDSPRSTAAASSGPQSGARPIRRLSFLTAR